MYLNALILDPSHQVFDFWVVCKTGDDIALWLKYKSLLFPPIILRSQTSSDILGTGKCLIFDLPMKHLLSQTTLKDHHMYTKHYFSSGSYNEGSTKQEDRERARW